MGLFDYVTVRDPRFVCSEGHDLSGEEFQTKDFGETMGRILIDRDGWITTRAVFLGTPEADSSVVEIYCTCTQCPAFVQFGTGNLCPCGVTFDVSLSRDRVTEVRRTGPSTAEWLASEPLARHMRNCEGPMPYSEASRLHAGYEEMRPEARAVFDRWSEARARALQAGEPWPFELRIGEYPTTT